MMTWWFTKFQAARRRRVWRLSEQQNHRCCYCARLTWVYDKTHNYDSKFIPDRLPGMTSQQMATADHLIPSSKGGLEKFDNIVMCCMRCNVLRGNMDAMQFWETVQNPTKVRSMMRKRGSFKRERKAAKRIKRQIKHDQFALWLGYLSLISPHIRNVFAAIEVLVEDYERKYKVAQEAKMAFYGDLLAIKRFDN